MSFRNAVKKERILIPKGVKIVIKGHGGRIVSRGIFAGIAEKAGQIYRVRIQGNLKGMSLIKGQEKLNTRICRKRYWRYGLVAVFVFLMVFFALLRGSRAYAAGLPEIFMGTFSDVFVGTGNDGRDDSSK
ncbi:MAG: hypothetical protein IJU43_10380, partial [Lachnospiraceae bacterium]|nr:hypothetical protein [Lachnospiraceae bacterium]